MSLFDFAGIAAVLTFGPLVVPAAWVFCAWAFAQEYRTRGRRAELRAALETETRSER